MAIHINLTNLMKKENYKAKLHWMPCVIRSNGESKVSAYFEPIIKERKDGVLQSSFRGYPMLGKELNIPKNYRGIVLQESSDKLSEEVERNLYGTRMFENFTYWNWDSEPSTTDKINMAMEWLDVAQAVSKI